MMTQTQGVALGWPISPRWGFHNRAISTMEVIEELIKLAKEMDAATKRGEDLGLTDGETAFYDAPAVNESAVKAMGDDKLKLLIWMRRGRI